MYPHRFPLRPIATALVMAFALPTTLLAEEEKVLSAMTVSQERPVATVNNPSSQASVSAEQITQMNVVGTEDVVKYVPGLNVRTRYIGDRNSVISARTSVGTTPAATSLVYADGLLLSNLLGNNYSYPPRWNLVGSEEIESVDVLYGPFSAMLPGNSQGVTIFMTTRRPEHNEVHARVQGWSERYDQYSSHANHDGNQTQVQAGFKVNDQLRISVLGNHLDTHGHPQMFTTKTPVTSAYATNPVTGFSSDRDTTGASRYLIGATSIDHTIQDTGKIKLEYDFSPSTRAALTWAQFRNVSDYTSDSYLRDASGNTVWGTSAGTDVTIGGNKYTVKASDFSLSHAESLNELLGATLSSQLTSDFKLDVAASDYKTVSDLNKAATNGMATIMSGAAGTGTITDGYGTGWKNLDLRGTWKPSGRPEHTVATGYHYDQYTYSSYKWDTSDWTSNSRTTLNTSAEGKTRTQALYLQDVWKFAQDLSLTAGLRHERWQAFEGSLYDKSSTAASGRPGERENSYNSPKASLAWQATPDWVLKASVARAYRMPTVTELYATQTDASGNKTISDPNLNPEKILATDLTAEGAVYGGLLRISYFHEDKEDFIYSQKTSVGTIVTKTMNIDKATVDGLEMAYGGNDVLIRGFDLMGSITYADGKITQNATKPEWEGRPIPIPQWRAALFASYRANDQWSGSVGVKYSSDFPNPDASSVNQNTYGGSSGYTFTDVRVNYKLNKTLTASVGVNNLGGNKAYAYHPYSQETYHAQLKADF